MAESSFPAFDVDVPIPAGTADPAPDYKALWLRDNARLAAESKLAEDLGAGLREMERDRFNDLCRLLRALGLSDHARPISPAEVFDLCLRDIEGLRQRIPDAEADALRLHREKMQWFNRATATEAALAFYADPKSYAPTGWQGDRDPAPVIVDRGAKAIATLAEVLP